MGNADKDRAVVWILPQEPSGERFEKSNQIVPPTGSRRGEVGHQVFVLQISRESAILNNYVKYILIYLKPPLLLICLFCLVLALPRDHYSCHTTDRLGEWIPLS